VHVNDFPVYPSLLAITFSLSLVHLILSSLHQMPLEAFEAIRAVDRCPGGRQEYSGRGRLDPKMRFAIALGSGHTVNEVEHMAQQVRGTPPVVLAAIVLCLRERKG
jgi:hypothetical protein